MSVVAKLVTIMDSHISRRPERTGPTPLVSSQPSFCSQLEALIRSHLSKYCQHFPGHVPLAQSYLSSLLSSLDVKDEDEKVELGDNRGCR